jgi:hypothetical protein
MLRLVAEFIDPAVLEQIKTWVVVSTASRGKEGRVSSSSMALQRNAAVADSGRKPLLPLQTWFAGLAQRIRAGVGDKYTSDDCS